MAENDALSNARQREMQLMNLLHEVRDRASFLAFAAALIPDLEAWEAAPGDYGWRNGTNFGDCIGGSLRWADSVMHGEKLGHLFPEEPSWRAFAIFLYYGRVYE